MRRRTPELLHAELVSAAKSKVQHDLHGERFERFVDLDIDSRNLHEWETFDRLLDEMREP